MFEKVAILLIRLCLDYAQQCTIKKLGTCCKQNIALGTPPFEIKSALRIPPLLRLICQIEPKATRQATNYCRGSRWNIEATHPMGLKKRSTGTNHQWLFVGWPLWMMWETEMATFLPGCSSALIAILLHHFTFSPHEPGTFKPGCSQVFVENVPYSSRIPSSGVQFNYTLLQNTKHPLGKGQSRGPPFRFAVQNQCGLDIERCNRDDVTVDP